MQRLKPGPFGGFFDSLNYDSPAFIPLVAVSSLLMFVLVATIWALWRRPRAAKADSRRGFEIIAEVKTSPGGLALSPDTQRRVAMLFSGHELEEATQLLISQCGTNLPFSENDTPEEAERVRYAALKLSNGSIAELRSAIVLAQTDWRDLLMAAGFGEDVTAHLRWEPTSRG